MMQHTEPLGEDLSSLSLSLSLSLFGLELRPHISKAVALGSLRLDAVKGVPLALIFISNRSFCLFLRPLFSGLLWLGKLASNRILYYLCGEKVVKGRKD